MNEYVIIVAGGTGSRMKSDIPKQFMVVNGLPILMHTIHAFRAYSGALNIILVLPEKQFSLWESLCVKFGFDVPYRLVAGGETRFHSVKSGLQSIDDNLALVAVHDGVRPVIDRQIIARSFQTAATSGTAVASVPLKDSVRSLGPDGGNAALDRSAIRLIQTPQTFRMAWMSHAFAQDYDTKFTDCASVLESAGYPIHLIDGAYENIKITTPEDLKWAEIYLPKVGQ
jgi:2-C-methyl-D-erythritol 4-phosphate cytidylyltransferase